MDERLRERLESVDWGELPSRVHDWRNHVPLEVKQRWAELDLNGRWAVYTTAQAAADAEGWD